MNSAPHILVVATEGSDRCLPSARLECPEVTPVCEMWAPCEQAGCPAAAQDENLPEDSRLVILHGVEHRWFDQEVSREFWGVATGQCYAVDQNDALADEFADEQQLGAGSYAVQVEIDGNTVIISRPERQSA